MIDMGTIESILAEKQHRFIFSKSLQLSLNTLDAYFLCISNGGDEEKPFAVLHVIEDDLRDTLTLLYRLNKFSPIILTCAC